METGQEELTVPLLDEITINLGNLLDRDPQAGEVPLVPAKPAPKRRQKPRNTVFDNKAAGK
ncbi:hypothetical protein OG210_16075 [Streptomyces sp. NBC_00466]|uniref:hypothetical protein n=1 Tax=Streptomyces sp. NBC_00466 TaxID=2903655 RepID=UPI0030E3F784